MNQNNDKPIHIKKENLVFVTMDTDLKILKFGGI